MLTTAQLRQVAARSGARDIANVEIDVILTYLLHLLTAGPSTIDPIRAAVPLPPGIDPRLVGAAVRALATARVIRRAGVNPE